MPFSHFSTMPTWSDCPSWGPEEPLGESQSKKIIMPGVGSMLLSAHCPRSLNHWTPFTQPANLCNQCDIMFYSVSDTFKISSSTQSVYRPCCSNLFLKRIRLCTTRRVSSLLKYRYLFSFFNITISPPLSIAYKKNGCLSTVRFNLIG